ncbi:MAG TPA: apolipoprotein N-acyltransferase [Micromonosporaceae bacterium]
MARSSAGPAPAPDGPTRAGLPEVTGTPPVPTVPGATRSGLAERLPRAYRWWPVAAAIAAGLVLYAAFPPVNLWWAAPIGVALLAVATHRRRGWAGAGLGMLAGVAFFVPLLSWAGGYVGAVWLFLPAGEAAYFALLGALSARVSPVTSRWPWSWPLATGTLWVLQEALRDRTPFGGFPWGGLAFSQADSPLLHFAAIGGAPVVTFVVAMTGGLLVWVGQAVIAGRRSGLDAVGRRVWLPTGLVLVVAVVGWSLPVLAPARTDPQRVTVAIVQGNVPRLGLDFNAQRRAVLDNHVNATLQLAAEVAAGRRPRPDLVVWPENASDIDPTINADARDRIDAAAAAVGVPILVGGLLVGPGKGVRNVSMVWNPATGPGQFYVKRHPVPFAEYMPIRPVVRLITDKVDLVRSDFVAGPTPGVLQVGQLTVGAAICFEVAYDDVVRDTVTGGARLLVVQTNNATFNEAEARQQLAMVRLRAVEHGRSALMASTVGVSAFVEPDGRAYDQTQFNEPAVIVREVPLASARTIATEVGNLGELALVFAALALLVAAAVLRRRPAVPAGQWPGQGEVER